MLDSPWLWLLVVLGLFALAYYIQKMPRGRRRRRKRANLAAHLMTRTLTEDHIRGLREFLSEIREGLQVADADSEMRRRVIEAVDLRATLTVEEGERVVHAHCIADSKDFRASSRTARSRSVQLLGIALGKQPGRLDDQRMASYNRPGPARKCLRNARDSRVEGSRGFKEGELRPKRDTTTVRPRLDGQSSDQANPVAPARETRRRHSAFQPAGL